MPQFIGNMSTREAIMDKYYNQWFYCLIIDGYFHNDRQLVLFNYSFSVTGDGRYVAQL